MCVCVCVFPSRLECMSCARERDTDKKKNMTYFII